MNVEERWSPPEGWLRLTTIDAHAAGEPLRIITGGLPELPGATILERRRWLREHLDYLRTALLWEPRGHADMYGCIITPAVSPEADFGVIFLHNEGYSTMCGHGIIAVVTVALETAMLPSSSPETEVKIDTPAGLVTTWARVEGGRVRGVRFRNVPSFVLTLDEEVEVPEVGWVSCDIAFGGAFYAYVRAEALGLDCTPKRYRELIEVGTMIKRAVTQALPIAHPFEEDLSFLYGTIFICPPRGAGANSRNVCIFAEGQVDRSPTGTGVSGRLALDFARGELRPGEPLVVESIIGSRFTGRIVATTDYGPYKAIIPEIEGCAHITGQHEFLIDPDDPLGHGFILR